MDYQLAQRSILEKKFTPIPYTTQWYKCWETGSCGKPKPTISINVTIISIILLTNGGADLYYIFVVLLLIHLGYRHCFFSSYPVKTSRS